MLQHPLWDPQERINNIFIVKMFVDVIINIYNCYKY
jgi:hypothetical protein